jgi:hypothetical protein
MPAKSARTGLPYWVVAGGFGALLALGIAVAVVIYFRLIRYERVAAQHVPRDAAFVVRLDVEQAIVYEPFRRHLLPLADRGRVGANAGPARVLDPRLERIKRHTGIELAVDMRELLFARGPSEREWLLVIGGKFPKQGVVKGLHTVLLEEGVQAELAPGEHVVTLPSGSVLGQAEDGALLFASGRAWLDGALRAQAIPPELGLNVGQAAALAATSRGLPALPAIWSIFDPALTAELSVQQLRGELALAAVPTLRARIRLAPGASAAAAEARLRDWTRGARMASAEQNAPGGQPSAGKGLEVSRGGEAELRIEGPWPRENLDGALESFGRWLAKSVAP